MGILGNERQAGWSDVIVVSPDVTENLGSEVQTVGMAVEEGRHHVEQVLMNGSAPIVPSIEKDGDASVTATDVLPLHEVEASVLELTEDPFVQRGMMMRILAWANKAMEEVKRTAAL